MASQNSDTGNNEDYKSGANNVGAVLQASRLRLGDDLRFVSETLHIRFIYLEAIEAGRFDELPGPAYAIGFIRSYADYLGLDSEEVVRRYKAESASRSGSPDLVFPVPIPESSIPGGAIVFVGVVVAILAYGGWYVSTAKDGFLAGLVSPVPERLSEEKQVQEPEMKPETVETAPVESAPEVIEQVQSVEQAVMETTEEIASSETETVEQVVQESTETVQEVQETVVQATTEVAQEVQETSEQAVAEVQQTVEQTQQPATETVAQSVTETVEQTVAQTPAEAPSEQVSESPETPQTPEQSPAVEPEAENTSSETASAEPTDNTTAALQEAEVSANDADEAEEEPAESSAPVETSTPAETSAPTETASTTNDPEPTSTTRVYGSENENSRILVKARKNSWIQVRDNNANRLVMTRLLRAGDSYRVPDQTGLVLLTGNAGALEILVDGQAVPDLGEAGKVRRNVTLDPDLLRQGTAAQ